MTSFPTNQTVRHRSHVAGSRTPRGNVADSYGDPVDVPVYGWYITATTEPASQGYANQLKADALVFVPPGFRPSENDLVELPGVGWFNVIGITQDFNHGPFGWSPGNVVNLERMTG